MEEQRYCKRLIEVDLPIKKISLHATMEKNIRQGHISTLHIWWTRKPLAACRATILASLWPDPADPNCPKNFRKEVSRVMQEFRDKRGGKSRNWNDPFELRQSLLDFIADFADWENSTNRDFRETSRLLVKVAHECIGISETSKSLIVDPFSGGGSIPLEALRVGTEVFASDLNPVAVLLNKVILEYIPRYGQALADKVCEKGHWIGTEAEKELSKFYPKDSNGDITTAYIWARTMKCEGPGCGAEVPLISDLCLAKKGNNSVALKIVPNTKLKKIDFELLDNVKADNIQNGTVKRGAALCPICGFTTPANNTRSQFKGRSGGANDARLLAVVTSSSKRSGKGYRLPQSEDFEAIASSKIKLEQMLKESNEKDSILPEELFPYLRSIFNIQLLDVTQWKDLFSFRQNLALATFVKLIKKLNKDDSWQDQGLKKATISVLALVVSKLANLTTSFSRWERNVQCVQDIFGRQAIGIIWDFAEGNPVGDSRGSFSVYLKGMIKLITNYKEQWLASTPHLNSATKIPLPDDCADCIVTDPPYYDLVPYADLSDFFYVWLKRMLIEIHGDLFNVALSPKEQEIVQLAERNPAYSYKTKQNYENLMLEAMMECRRVLRPEGICVVLFAHKGTTAWESQLQAMIDAGWIIVASWPIDTELATRLRSINSAVLASTIYLVCRPRENPDGSMIIDSIGDWRDVLHELPIRIHEWMPRLAQEGVVGADAIFACLGPALEVFSKYSCVEKADGKKVELKEYLEQIWAAVAKEALNMIFKGAHTEGFEEDARLSAMWLWTLSAAVSNGQFENNEEDESEASEEISKGPKISGFILEYDAARKIAQGLGAHLEDLSSIIRVEGEKTTLLSVSERVQHLFGKGSTASTSARKKKKENQITLFEELNKVEDQGWSLGDEKSSVGKTILDRLHQAMILFGSGRGDAMRRFLVDEGIGKDERFWRLAQAFSALYPSHTDEKRWVDGVLARKKSLGF